MSHSIRWPAFGILLGLCAAWAIWGGNSVPRVIGPDVSVPLESAIPVHTSTTNNAAGSAQHGATVLKFSPDIADFGDVPVNESRKLTIEVTNPSSAPITLSEIRPSCGCLSVDAPNLVIQPGKSIPIHLSITALPGKKKEVLNLYFHTDERKDNICAIEVHIYVREAVLVEPNVLKFERLKKNESKTLTTSVRSADGKPFKIKTIACARPEFTFSWEPLGDGSEYKVTATLQSTKGGISAETAGVVTDRAESGTAPLHVSGMIDNDLSCMPPTVTAQSDEQRMVGAFTTVIKRTSPGRLEIIAVTEASRPPQNLPLDFVADRLDESSCRLSIKFKTAYPPRAPFGQFLVKTNVEEEDYRLPFRVNGLPGLTGPSAAPHAPTAPASGAPVENAVPAKKQQGQ